MNYFIALTSALSLLTGSLAVPLAERQGAQTVHLTFHCGPAEYSMAFPADGTVYSTNETNMAVDIIDAPDYNAYGQCQFMTAGQATLASGFSSTGVNQIHVGPPQPVLGVSCQGMCVPTYGECFRNGQYVGPCCNGFCAANRCRPWVNPSV